MVLTFSLGGLRPELWRTCQTEGFEPVGGNISITSASKLIKIGENVQAVYIYLCVKGFLKIIYEKAARGRQLKNT